MKSVDMRRGWSISSGQSGSSQDTLVKILIARESSYLTIRAR